MKDGHQQHNHRPQTIPRDDDGDAAAAVAALRGGRSLPASRAPSRCKTIPHRKRPSAVGGGRRRLSAQAPPSKLVWLRAQNIVIV